MILYIFTSALNKLSPFILNKLVQSVGERITTYFNNISLLTYHCQGKTSLT